MLLLAHRGYHADAPENSMASFEAAIKCGVDGIETDVRLSADDLPVIMHDRVTRHGRAVSELSRRELEDDVGHAVPVLDEILDAFPDILWNIEIKNPEAWRSASAALTRYRSKRRLLVTSFRHDVVKRCADDTGIACALLVAHRPLDVDAIIAQCAGSPAIAGMVWDYNIVDDGVLGLVSDAGWDNYVYGAVTTDEHQRCRALMLTGLITDYPALGRKS